MSKIFLEVQVPGNAKTYEFSADSTMTVGRVKNQIIRQISALENRDVFPDPAAVLFCAVDLEGLLQDQEVLGSVGIRSGSKIMLLYGGRPWLI